MRIDLLVAEIGSTTTVVNAFNGINNSPMFIGQGQASTTVLEGDVNIGLRCALDNLKINLGVKYLDYDELLATSSAAGGLCMTVHGLVYDMTVRAAKEAALGAGANIKFITSGKLRNSDIRKIIKIKPNIILIAGGVDFGERETALHNASMIANLGLKVPVIYAGNIQNREDIKDIFEDNDIELYLVDNVYPKIDELNIEPTRGVIPKVFEKHIIKAPGMEKLRDMVTGNIMPTPGAVMEASMLLYNYIGDLITIDVGGATTDIHSVTHESQEISRILLSPEPLAKRTVEGDLGVYLNIEKIVELVGKEKLSIELDISDAELRYLINNHKPIPERKVEKEFVEALTLHATLFAIRRHCGHVKQIFAPGGKKTIAEGKDLTQVKYIIGTGGALTRLPNNNNIISNISNNNYTNELLPKSEAIVLIDNDYIMASLGVMSKKYPNIALKLLKNSLKI